MGNDKYKVTGQEKQEADTRFRDKLRQEFYLLSRDAHTPLHEPEMTPLLKKVMAAHDEIYFNIKLPPPKPPSPPPHDPEYIKRVQQMRDEFNRRIP
jgi:hypothetical protein